MVPKRKQISNLFQNMCTRPVRVNCGVFNSMETICFDNNYYLLHTKGSSLPGSRCHKSILICKIAIGHVTKTVWTTINFYYDGVWLVSETREYIDFLHRRFYCSLGVIQKVPNIYLTIEWFVGHIIWRYTYCSSIIIKQ